MIQIRLQPEIESELAAEAQAQGLAPEHYVARIVNSRPEKHAQQRSVGEAIDAIRELRKGNILGDLNLNDLIHEGHKYL